MSAPTIIELFKEFDVDPHKVRNLDDMMSHDWVYDKKSGGCYYYICSRCNNDICMSSPDLRRASRSDFVDFVYNSCDEMLMDGALG